MVVRLLVVVLTLLGAIPVRICTCGAAHDHPAAPVLPSKSPCGHDHDDRGAPAYSDSTPSEHHDADCHAVKPRPLMTLGLQFDVTDIPPTDALAVALVETPRFDPMRGHIVRDFHPPPNRPIFLSHSVLRN